MPKKGFTRKDFLKTTVDLAGGAMISSPDTRELTLNEGLL